MRHTLLGFLLFMVLLDGSVARAAEAVRYHVASGSYLAIAPDGGTEEEALPVLFFFHGYQQTAETVLHNKRLLKAVAQKGVLLVIPDGLERTWSHQGSPSDLRDETAFVRQVLRDLRRKWPVDTRRIWASGFSQGGSMTWDVACNLPGEFTAFFPVAGAFWRPQPQSCNGPVNLRHIHGRSDKVVPMEGRSIEGKWHQGDVRQGMALWRDVNGCAAEPTLIERLKDMECRKWLRCRSGRELALCLHPGGHGMKADWIVQGIDWANRLAAGSSTVEGG